MYQCLVAYDMIVKTFIAKNCMKDIRDGRTKHNLL